MSAWRCAQQFFPSIANSNKFRHDQGHTTIGPKSARGAGDLTQNALGSLSGLPSSTDDDFNYQDYVKIRLQFEQNIHLNAAHNCRDDAIRRLQLIVSIQPPRLQIWSDKSLGLTRAFFLHQLANGWRLISLPMKSSNCTGLIVEKTPM